ncbi:MAG TPA: hypothetical protein VFX39_02000, partial [Gemmatimonadaceae bacterium]|nr:hypothetical protein [Gemmatimonadaceae bacterium]
EFGISSGIGGVGVMRFRSASSAWLVDGGVSLSRGRADAAGGAASDMDQYSVDLRAGLRRYHPLRRSTTVFHTLGAHGGFSRASTELSGVPDAPESTTQTSRSWRAGLFAELGGSYFLTSNLSLGASTRLDAGYSRTSSEYPTGPGGSSRHLFLSTGGTRLLGTIYF